MYLCDQLASLPVWAYPSAAVCLARLQVAAAHYPSTVVYCMSVQRLPLPSSSVFLPSFTFFWCAICLFLPFKALVLPFTVCGSERGGGSQCLTRVMIAIRRSSRIKRAIFRWTVVAAVSALTASRSAQCERVRSDTTDRLCAIHTGSS